MTLIDVACAGQLRTAWTNVDIARPVEGEVGSAEGTAAPFRRRLKRRVPVSETERTGYGVTSRS